MTTTMNKLLVRLFSIAILTSCIAVSALAQDAFVARYLTHLKTSRDFTIKVAQQMPDADYGYKLTPPQMSFGEQLAHLAETNLWLYSTMAGEKSPLQKPKQLTKANVIQYLEKSFDYSIGVLAKLSKSQLEKSYPAEGRTMAGWDMVMLSLDHTTHHRAQCEMYLRVKGITPTEYQF
jgi:uncharacterized damage-inducible protein DinB